MGYFSCHISQFIEYPNQERMVTRRIDKFVQIAPGVNVSVGFSIMEGIQTGLYMPFLSRGDSPACEPVESLCVKAKIYKIGAREINFSPFLAYFSPGRRIWRSWPPSSWIQLAEYTGPPGTSSLAQTSEAYDPDLVFVWGLFWGILILFRLITVTLWVIKEPLSHLLEVISNQILHHMKQW